MTKQESLDFHEQPIIRNAFALLTRNLAGKDVFWAILLFLFFLFLSYRFLGLWFMQDDAACIYGSTRAVDQLLFDRDVYRSFNKMFYTPLLPISIKPDSLLFGVDPLGYHVLNLFAVFFSTLMGYATCRLYLPRLDSWLVAFLFVLSYPAVTNAGYLSLRHYVWGTFFTLFALLLFKKGEEKSRVPFFLASYGAYLVALLFKEAFAAFPGIILLLSQGTWKRKTLKAVPYLLVFAAYVVLRFYMIGGPGGYLGLYIAPTVKGYVDHWFAQMDLVCRGTWGLRAATMIPFFLVVLALNGRAGATLTGILLLLTAPFLVLKVPGEGDHFHLFYLPPRFLLPFFLLCALLGFTTARARTGVSRLLAYATVAVLLALQVTHARNAYPFMKAASEEARALTAEALRRNGQGRNLLLASYDAIFYTYFYESYLRITDERKTGVTVSVTPGGDFLPLLKDLDFGSFDEVYLDGTWTEVRDEPIPFTGLTLDPDVPEAEVRFSVEDGTGTLIITDRREEIFYGVLKTLLSDKNIVYQCLPLPKNVPLRLGLSRGMDTVYVYCCSSGRCSEPVWAEAD